MSSNSIGEHIKYRAFLCCAGACNGEYLSWPPGTLTMDFE